MIVIEFNGTEAIVSYKNGEEWKEKYRLAANLRKETGEILKEKLKAFFGQKVAIILAEKDCYVTSWQKKSREPVAREEVAVTIKEKIPENFSDLAWDYKAEITDEANGVQTITVYAPVGEIWNKLNNLIGELDWNLIALEPDVIARQRNNNLALAIAQKVTEGPDYEVLNISHNVSSKISKRAGIVMGIIILLVLATAGIWATTQLNYLKDDEKTKLTAPVEPTATITPTTLPTPTPPPVKVIILNGSGIKGEADRLKEKLEANEKWNIETGNADSFNYKGISVYYQKPEHKDVASELLAGAGGVGVATNGELPQKNGSDIVIVIGR